MNLNVVQLVKCPRERDVVYVEVCATCILNENVGSTTVSCLWDEVGRLALQEACKERCSECSNYHAYPGRCTIGEDPEDCSRVLERYDAIVRSKLNRGGTNDERR